MRNRLTIFLLAIPLVVMSCGTASQVPRQGAEDSILEISSLPSEAYFHFLRGYLAELAKEPDRAIEEYQIGLEYDPESLFLRTRMAQLYFSNGEMASAVAMVKGIDPDRVIKVSTLLQVARIYAGAGYQERALTFYTRAIELNPNHVKSYLSKGMLLITLKRFEEAKQVFEKVLEVDAHLPEGHYFLGVLALENQHPRDAQEHFKRAIELKGNFARGYRSLAGLYQDQGEIQKAIAVYEEYLQRVNPHHKEFRLQLVRLHLAAHSYEKALEQLTFILDDNPDDLGAQVRVALIHGQMGNYTQAIEGLIAILKARPNELRVRDYLGQMYEELKDTEQAVEAYETNLKIDPTYYDSHLHLGFLSYRLKRYKEAISYLNQAVSLNPKRSESYLLLGLTYLQTEQYHLAVDRLEEGIQQDPSNPDLQFNLGTAYGKLDQFEDVEQAMKETIRLDPEYADALNYLGYSYASRGIHIEEALHLTQRAVHLKPDNGYYVDSLGWALFKLGRNAEALETIQRAVSLVEDDPVIFEHLGEIYLAQKNLSKAKEAWSRSIQLDSSNQNLINRFRQQGFKEAVPASTVQSDLPRMSHSSTEFVPSP